MALPSVRHQTSLLRRGVTVKALRRLEGETLLIGALVTATLALVCVLAWQILTPDPFDPIEFSPDPRPVIRVEEDGAVVVPVIDGYDGPAVYVGDTVPTGGQRCVDHPEPVEAIADVWWESVDPGGVRVQVLRDFPSAVEAGCVSLRFENEIPDAVAQRVNTEGASQWRITGAATPTADGGVTETWAIEPFWLVPADDSE